MREAHMPMLFTNNISAKHMFSNPMMHARMKHVEIDFHFICDELIQEKLDVRYAPYNEQVAFVFTKPLGETRFTSNKTKLMVLLA